MHTTDPKDYVATEKYWNEMTNAARVRLLKEAGFAHAAFSARAFKFIPHYIRVDLIYCYQRSLAQPLPNKPPPQAVTA